MPSDQQPPRSKSTLREVAETILIALVVALLIRHFVFEVYLVDGPSMSPTLETGQRVVVAKFVHYTRTPRPGEITVFRFPLQPDRDFVKRVIAVAGDTVEIRQGQVYVNGKLLAEDYVISRDQFTHPPVVVPEKAIYVLGDNRANSTDSRFFGTVPLHLVKGPAVLRFWPPDTWQVYTAAGPG